MVLLRHQCEKTLLKSLFLRVYKLLHAHRSLSALYTSTEMFLSSRTSLSVFGFSISVIYSDSVSCEAHETEFISLSYL